MSYAVQLHGLRDVLRNERPPRADDIFCTPIWRRQVAYTDAPPLGDLLAKAMLLGGHATG